MNAETLGDKMTVVTFVSNAVESYFAEGQPEDLPFLARESNEPAPTGPPLFHAAKTAANVKTLIKIGNQT